MTPDGISTEDWDRVHGAACDIVNASAIDDDVLWEHYTERLFEILDELETRYGRIPAILATRADFSDDAPLAIALHEEALAVAKDPISIRLSLLSLVELMIDERKDEGSIAARLSELEQVTDSDCDSWEIEMLQELRTKFEQAIEGCA